MECPFQEEWASVLIMHGFLPNGYRKIIALGRQTHFTGAASWLPDRFPDRLCGVLPKALWSPGVRIRFDF